MFRTTIYIILICFSVNTFSQTLSGHIKDINGAALPNANIVIDKSGAGTVSDVNGFYKIENISPGKHNIKISFVGYGTEVMQIVIEVGKNSVKDIILNKSDILTREIEINARKSDGFDRINAPVRIKTLNTEEIHAMPALSTSNLFNTVSGVDVKNDFGIFSSQTVVSLRGFGGDSQTGTLVVVDGTPVNKSESGSVNWNMIDKESIEKIEIMKGPGSVLFGSNAMGGVINITTGKPKSAFALDVSAGYGRFNTIDAGFNVSGKSKSGLVYWKVNGMHRQSDGYVYTPDYEIIENDTIIVPVYLNEYSAGALLGVQFDERNKLELSFNYYDDRRGTGIRIFEDMGGNDEHDTFHAFAKYKGMYRKFSLFSNIYLVDENYNKLNEYYSEGEYKLYEIDSKRFDYGTKIWAEYPVQKNLELLAGGEFKTGSVNARDIYYTSTDIISNMGSMNTAALFAQVKWNILKQLLLYGGLRYDRAFFHDASFDIAYPSYSIEYLTDYRFDNLENKTWNSVNPKFTLEYRYKDANKLYISAANGFGAPILEDLCRTGRKKIGFKIANPNLKPEYITNFEIGNDFTFFNKLNTSISAFYTIGKDFMYFITTGDSVNMGYTIAPVYKVENIGKVEIYGLEADANLPLFENVRLYANYTYNHSVIKEFTVNNPEIDKDLTGKFLTDVPMHKFSAGVSFENKIVNISTSCKYTGERWLNDENKVDDIYLHTDKYPAYFVVDLKIWKNIKSFTVSVNVDNLLNTIYTDSKGYKSPGIFYMCKIKYSFNKNQNE